MTHNNRLVIWEGLVIAMLLLLTGLGNSWLMLIAATLLLGVGIARFPEQRKYGLLAAIVACILALVAASLWRLPA